MGNIPLSSLKLQLLQLFLYSYFPFNHLLPQSISINPFALDIQRSIPHYLPALLPEHPEGDENIQGIVDSSFDILLILSLELFFDYLLVYFFLIVQLIHQLIGYFLIGSRMHV